MASVRDRLVSLDQPTPRMMQVSSSCIRMTTSSKRFRAFTSSRRRGPVTIVWMSLEPKDHGRNAAGDLDLFLLGAAAASWVRLGSSDNPRCSATGTSHDLIGVALRPEPGSSASEHLLAAYGTSCESYRTSSRQRAQGRRIETCRSRKGGATGAASFRHGSMTGSGL
jgi:hypothetical protein